MGEKQYSNVSTTQYDTVEFRAAKLQYQDAILFLQRQCDGLLSTGEAKNWCYQISRIFPESRLAKTFNTPVTIMSRKKTRLAARKAAQREKSREQTEMLFSFTFKKE